MGAEYQFWVLNILYAFIFIFGITANILVVVYFGFKMKRHSSFRWFLIQLSIADCICCFISPLQIFYIHATGGKWYLGSFVCKVITPVGFITVNVSGWILCAIAYERFRAIGYPLKARYSKKSINILCFLCWVGSLVLAIPYFLWTENKLDTCGIYWTREQQLVAALLALFSQSIIPIIVMAVSCVCIKRAFIKQKKKVLNTRDDSSLSLSTLKMAKEDHKSDLSAIRARAKVTTQTLHLAFITFVVCSLPYNILYVLGVVMFRFDLYSFEEKRRYSSVYDQWIFWLSLLVILNSVMNSFIYAGKFPAFRKFIWSGLCSFRKQKQNDVMVEQSREFSSMATCSSPLAMKVKSPFQQGTLARKY